MNDIPNHIAIALKVLENSKPDAPVHTAEYTARQHAFMVIYRWLKSFLD